MGVETVEHKGDGYPLYLIEIDGEKRWLPMEKAGFAVASLKATIVGKVRDRRNDPERYLSEGELQLIIGIAEE